MTDRRPAESERLYREACGLMPGGVSSPVRAFGAVGGHPPFIERGGGADLVGVDGRRVVDWGLSRGGGGDEVRGPPGARVRENRQVLGIAGRAGAFAERVVVPLENLHRDARAAR